MKTLVRVALTFCFSCALIWAQGGTTAQIHGVVQDASGAAVPGVEVKAIQTATGAVRVITSEADGSYVLSNLPIGPYRLEVSKEGFNKFVQEGIVLQVNSDPLINPSLKVGAVSEQVVVEANVTQVETRNSTVGAVIDNKRILELPLDGRNVTDLISLSGAAVVVATTRDSMGGGTNPTPLLQVAGGMVYATSYTLDGANHLNTNSGGALNMPFPDALQEFKVDTSGATVDQGKASAVSAVTKSGTNSFHGDLFEFMRNDAVNAHAYFSKVGSTLKRNQFGGTIGGPILRDKLFFFGGYQQTMIRENPNDLETFLPTAAMLSGDWTAFASAACNGGTPKTLRGGFTNNRIDPSRFSATGLAIAKLTLANAPAPEDDCGHLTYGRPRRVNEYQGVGRVDYQMSQNHSLFVRYQDVVPYAPNPYYLQTPHNVLNAGTSGTDNVIQSLSLGSTYIFSPTVVNSFRLGGSYALARTLGADTFSICDAQIAAKLPVTYYCGQAPHRSTLQIIGGPTLGSGSRDPFDAFTLTVFSLNDDVGVIRGAHQMDFGFTGSISTNKSNWNALNINKFTFNSAATGTGWSDVFLGDFAQLIQTGSNSMDITETNIALYASDTWKVLPRLTVSASLRWEPFIPQYMKHGAVANFDYNRFLAGQKTTLYKYAPAGWLYPGDPGGPSNRGSDIRWGDFAPRLGLAWDVNGDGKTAIRASYGYSYSPVLNYWRQDQYAQNPWNNGTRIQNSTNLNDPWGTYSWIDPVSGATRFGVPFPDIEGIGFTQFGDFTATSPDLKAPAINSWNFSIQRQITTDWLVSAAYIGTHASHIWIQDYLNPGTMVGPAPATGTTCAANLTIQQCSGLNNVDARRVFTLARPNDLIKMGAVSLLYSGANLDYNGLLLTAQKRISRGTSVQVNYTWSHCTADAADLQSSGPDAGESHTNPGHRDFDHGNCQGDRRHIFNLTAAAQSPRYSSPVLRWAASDWKLSGIYRWQAGQPIDISAGSDRAMNGQLSYFAGSAYQRANQLVPNDQAYNPDAGGPLSFWFKQSAFGLPALGTLGNYSRYNLVGPARWSFDMALSREFRVRESKSIEVRAEAFNVTNSFRPGVLDAQGSQFGNASNAQFGQIRTALDPRIMQFALKLVF